MGGFAKANMYVLFIMGFILGGFLLAPFYGLYKLWGYSRKGFTITVATLLLLGASTPLIIIPLVQKDICFAYPDRWERGQSAEMCKRLGMNIYNNYMVKNKEVIVEGDEKVEEVLKYFNKGCEIRKYGSTCFELSELYASGDYGIPKDMKKSKRYWEYQYEYARKKDNYGIKYEWEK